MMDYYLVGMDKYSSKETGNVYEGKPKVWWKHMCERAVMMQG